MIVYDDMFGDGSKIDANSIFFDSGSNSNGTWIKLPDGTQIVYGRARITDRTAGTNEHTLPVSFVAGTMICIAGVPYRASGGLAASFVSEIEPIGTNTIRIKTLIHGPANIAAPTIDVLVPFIVIGKYQ